MYLALKARFMHFCLTNNFFAGVVIDEQLYKMSLLFKSMPKPMVKIEDDDDVIIDLGDTFPLVYIIASFNKFSNLFSECTEVPQSKGPVNRWHQHVLFMLKKCWMTMSEMHFDDFIKFYRR